MSAALRVLHQDEHLVAVDKPAGLLVIPGRQAREELTVRQLLEQQLGRSVWVVHRLDRETSGVLVFALDPSAHRELSMAFEAGRIDKRYLALVQGQLTDPRTIELPLVPARRGKMRPARGAEQGKPAVTRVQPLERFARHTLVEAQPLTGRTHQIRVHLLSIGHGLLVDPQYGQASQNTSAELGGQGDAVVLARTPLHAAQLSWPALDGLGATTVRAPVPADFEAALALLRA